MMEWWEFTEELPAQTSGVAPGASGPERDALGALSMAKPDAPLARSRADRIAAIEEEVHSEAATVINDAMHFMAFDPTSEEPPEAWVAELGPEGARRRMRTAQMAHLPSKEAPIGLKLAKDTLVGMTKAKAARKAPSTTLNMVVVQMQGPLPQYPRREILK